MFTGQNIFFLSNLPSETLFTEFITVLVKEIKKQQTQNAPACPSLIDQLQELARLKSEGLLDETEFAKIKKNIIESSTPQPAIGFNK